MDKSGAHPSAEIQRALFFTAKKQVRVIPGALPPPGKGEVTVRARLSALSAGTEMLVYRDQMPDEMKIDETIPALGGTFRYPLRYGYASVGQVCALGAGVPEQWLGRRVFAFYPHADYFTLPHQDLHLIPDDMGWEDAVFLPNMETAVNLVMDAAPRIGESAAVFGQGVIGLLCTSLLAQFPLSTLAALDAYPTRRQQALEAGAHAALDPLAEDWRDRALKLSGPRGFDLALENSGNPQALDQALALTGFAGRVVIGSWYGLKPVQVDLGGAFHRSRQRLISSQVSTIDPALSGRWDKSRRFQTAWSQIRRLRPSRWITHRIPFEQAGQAYALLDADPRDVLQIIFDYGG